MVVGVFVGLVDLYEGVCDWVVVVFDVLWLFVFVFLIVDLLVGLVWWEFCII